MDKQDSFEGTRGIPLNSERQFKALTLEKIKVQTLREKLELERHRLDRHRLEIWNSWNEEYFKCFAEAFSKFKNELIALHLSQQQLNVLQDKLEAALESLQIKLDFMYNDFMENGLGKEDLEDDKL